MKAITEEKLFSYGTLRSATVQLSTLGSDVSTLFRTHN